MPSAALILVFCTAAVAQVPAGYTVRDLKAGRYTEDSSFIYTLPYPKGHSVLLAQAYLSNLSHKSEFAPDFKMKEGSPVCAARAGVVTAARSDSQKGGLQPELLSEGKYLIILHDDGSQAHYRHLKPGGTTVQAGDSVQAGQVIGYSGNTGYSAFPHLHLEVVHQGRMIRH
ncbi:MAG TPA: M23 family metallopeptidase [Chitinophagaceae bacterium]|nr:M23 family metallopeptidase [Chitinophagaceae bacterium]